MSENDTDANADLLHSYGALWQRRPLSRPPAAVLVSSFLLLTAVFPQQQVERRHGNAVVDYKLKGVSKKKIIRRRQKPGINYVTSVVVR